MSPTRPTLLLSALAMSALEALAAVPAADTVAACERAAREALGSSRGPAVEVSFNAPPAAAPIASDTTEQLLRGAGRARSAAGSRSFTYSCNVNLKSGEVTGVVIRDAIAVGERTVAAPKVVEPDLSNVSPTACESSAAAALKRRWPLVSSIQFNGDTRALEQDSAGVARLRGQGTALPQPGGPSTHFSYQCEMDVRNGRVTATRVTD